MNKLRLALTGFLMIPAAFAVARHSAGEPPHQSPSAQNPFLGSWKLVSTEEKLKDGTSRPYKDVGPKGLGYLMYTADGHMCAVMTRPDRPQWDDPPTAAQKIAAIDGMASYCGPFEIDEVNHVMWHYPEIAWNPGFAGTKQRRPYRFEGNRLIFSGKQEPDEHQTVDRWTIVWEKMK
jgi:hypothetical protein